MLPRLDHSFSTRVGRIHSLRHSFGTHLMKAGVPLPTIQRLMGHTALSTTTRYLHVTARHVEGVRSPLDLLRMPDGDAFLRAAGMSGDASCHAAPAKGRIELAEILAEHGEAFVPSVAAH